MSEVESAAALDRTGPNTVSGLLAIANETEFVLEVCSEEVGDHGLREQFETLREETNGVLEEAEYREKAFEELQYMIDRYPSVVNHFLELEPVPNELRNDLDWRDRLEITRLELDPYFDLHDEHIRIETLDEVLRLRYEQEIDTVLDERAGVERSYYPESFWWRHPSKVDEELDSSSNGA
ncbi:hypothetical protein HT576_03720 [Haloterrigena sp. SYSU A121-1]|uniref:Uncharacterized protein n=1 Tax=Haloterrigena gelatinilytica TaxID=2741724 RepID=A0A8J8GHL7_9EURY|nr:hypothetical protein [Haloterrigena gelatinilytica]NUB90143.1 hypothetical protein [Haloterrigena gelatinilytica]